MLPALGGGADRTQSPDFPDRVNMPLPLPDGDKTGEPSPESTTESSAGPAPAAATPASPAAPGPGLSRQADRLNLGFVADMFLKGLAFDATDDRTPAERSADAIDERLVAEDVARSDAGTVAGVRVLGLAADNGAGVDGTDDATGVEGAAAAVAQPIDAASASISSPGVDRSIAEQDLGTTDRLYRNTALAAAAMLALAGLMFLWKAAKP
ncbi:MAG: hypothetical protein HKN26_08405 [Acidimicrobiales bacterium]|nr:hypothetical protein [Acidimicrobiales bacterium]